MIDTENTGYENTGEKKRGTGRYLNEAAPKRPKRRKKKSLLGPVVLAVIVLVLLVFLCVSCFGGDILKGQWRIDEITTYQFDGNGRGELILPDKTYSFTYAIEDDSLSIDFESDAARDFQYSFVINGKKLTLTGGEGNEDVTYELTKQ